MMSVAICRGWAEVPQGRRYRGGQTGIEGDYDINVDFKPEPGIDHAEKSAR
jgi:hypothetical protein